MNIHVFPGKGFTDAHAFVENGRVYLFCGRDKTPRTEDTWRMNKWTISSSDDLVHWVEEADILPSQTHLGADSEDCWAGYILKKEDKYYWFYSNKFIDIGVLVADKITGPYVNKLNKPLIPQGFAKTKSYDPCVFEEDGVYTIFWGANTYYCATLSDDLMSVVDEPQEIVILDENNQKVRTRDKITVFKRKNNYYIAYGDRYCMSDKLRGPYRFIGRFTGGGHNDLFDFKGKTYVCSEFQDTSLYFRGTKITELGFNEDGTVILDKDDQNGESTERLWNFTKGDNNWFLSDFSDVRFNQSGLLLDTDTEIGVRSPYLPGVYLDTSKKIYITLCNFSKSNNIELTVEAVYDGPSFRTGEREKILSKCINIRNDNASHTYQQQLNIDKPMFLGDIIIKSADKKAGELVIKQIEIK